ncbi:sensor domain-containing diguanylate cyclase [Entomohabitans teleogrylli]|uniref:sensor domain-containing diguanylate cyclase n=1 Tax=Entomohabitans teleogrylli TaxID=1384589 RepID=UPI00073D20B4|nr:sensor domain-containing diguanylate cyclase [Entomohabitans teleogrylli]
MAKKSSRLSFTTPLITSFFGILICFTLIAAFMTWIQRKDITEAYHNINRNFAHNLAMNYTESLLRSNEYILTRAATYFSREGELDNTVNLNPDQGRELLMRLLTLMPTVSTINIADTSGRFLRVPGVSSPPKSGDMDVLTRPWFVHYPESSLFTHYTPVYEDFYTHRYVVTIYKPLIDRDGRLKGTLAFDLDLASLGYALRQMLPPVHGEFFIVDRDGRTVLHPDPGMLFQSQVSSGVVDKMTSGAGYFYDKTSGYWYYYYSYTNPDWFIVYKVSGKTLSDLIRHESVAIIYGFAIGGIIILLFGFYLRHAASNVLMNIINAIKTGEVQRAPGLEALLSKEIESSKKREQDFVRQATVDELTGCKNRRAFDEAIKQRIDQHQPFALALMDIDNFKRINDTWGHLSGDIVLRAVAREGIKIMQPHDITIYRYGGEEFAVLFDTHHLDEALKLLDAWRLAVLARTWREQPLQVSFSAGFGHYNHEPAATFIAGVDAALYKAKQQGKNQIVTTSQL